MAISAPANVRIIIFAVALAACGTEAVQGAAPSSGGENVGAGSGTDSQLGSPGTDAGKGKTGDAGPNNDPDAGGQSDGGVEAGTGSSFQCSGVDLQASDVAPLLTGAGGVLRLGGFSYEGRTRDCTGASCDPWQSSNDGVGVVTAANNGPSGELALSLDSPLSRIHAQTLVTGATFDPSFFGGMLGDATGFQLRRHAEA